METIGNGSFWEAVSFVERYKLSWSNIQCPFLRVEVLLYFVLLSRSQSLWLPPLSSFPYETLPEVRIITSHVPFSS